MKKMTKPMLRWLESDHEPMRRCARCGEPMLTATIANAVMVQDTIADRDWKWKPDYVMAWHLKAMHNATFCCWCCRRGQPPHSHECFSAMEQARRRMV